MICNLCPRRCNSERTQDKNEGFCKSFDTMKVTRAKLHFWEEPCISGEKGSGTIFFSGCSLGCVYCQNKEISRGAVGKTVSPLELTEIFKRFEDQGANNINLVTCEHFAPKIAEAFKIYRPKIPVVLNSGGYISSEQLNMLKEYIDIYLLDLKYISSERAQKYSFAKEYPKIATQAIKFAVENVPFCRFDEKGIMKKGVIVRHLLMPLATREAMDVFDWVKENAGSAYFSLMGQYVPCGVEDYPEINRKITKREYKKVLEYICDSGFENCYIQDLSSATKDFIPKFDT